MKSIPELESRTFKLPESTKSRFREDPEIQTAVAQIAAAAQRMAGVVEATPADLEEVEALQQALSDVWEAKLKLAEIETQISSVSDKALACRYCGSSFPEPGQGNRLRNHVQKLHPREWAAAQSA